MRPTIFLVLLGVTTLWGQDSLKKDATRTGISFELNQKFGAILIRVRVNGLPAVMVVDTGSSNTAVSSELLPVSHSTHAFAPARGSGYVGSAEWAKATVEVGPMIWPDRSVLVMDDFQDLSKSMKQKVDGILGEDILKEFNSIVIDFKHHRLLVLR